MSARFDPTDPLSFGPMPSWSRLALRDRPLLPPGGTRRVVADLLADTDTDTESDTELEHGDARATDGYATDVDDLLAELFGPARAFGASDDVDGERWSAAHRAAVETWWSDDTDTAGASDRARHRHRRVAGSHRRAGRLVTLGAGVLAVFAAFAAPLLARAAGGGGQLGLARSSVSALLRQGVGSTVAADVVTANMPTRAIGGPASAMPLVTPASRLATGVYLVVFGRLRRDGVVVSGDTRATAAQRTFSALRGTVASQFGVLMLDAAGAGLVPDDRPGATVELGEHYRMMGTPQQVLVIGQIVLSLAANGVSPVRFVSTTGEPMVVPDGHGAYASDTVTADDYGFVVTTDPDYRPGKSTRG